VAVIFPVHLNPNVRKVMDEALAGPGQCRDDRAARLSALRPPDRDCGHHADRQGGVQEEAPALGKPVLVMRETTERPEGVAAGTAKLVGTDAVIVTEIFNLARR
jgi:UDP-N-acetylglucosamine 2-epimerase (non-hydrolysing)